MSEERTRNESISEIIRQSAAGERSSAGGLSQDDLKTLADKVDLLTADFGRWESYKAASTEYISAFKTEITWHRRIRLSVTIACALIIVFLTSCLVYGIRFAGLLFRPDQAHALTALIVGCITGTVIVTIAVVKGAFSTLADRNAGLPMPEHVKEIVEAAKTIVGGSGH